MKTDSTLFEELRKRRAFFQDNFPMIKIGRQRTDVNSLEILKNSCPVCGYLTLSERDSFDICPICFWEDDGIDDFEADEESGPNQMTLTEGRRVFLKAKERLFNTDLSNDKLKEAIRNNFLSLDNLIENKKKDEILKTQQQIVDLLTENKIYGLETLFE